MEAYLIEMDCGQDMCRWPTLLQRVGLVSRQDCASSIWWPDTLHHHQRRCLHFWTPPDKTCGLSRTTKRTGFGVPNRRFFCLIWFFFLPDLVPFCFSFSSSFFSFFFFLPDLDPVFSATFFFSFAFSFSFLFLCLFLFFFFFFFGLSKAWLPDASGCFKAALKQV